MNERKLEERFYSEHVKGEWEPSDRFDVSRMSAADVAQLVRRKNEAAKRDGEWVRFRSVAVEDQFE